MKKSIRFLWLLSAILGFAVMSGGMLGAGDDVNDAPSADAGEDYIVGLEHKAVLDGSGSLNAGSYKWTQTEGPKVALSDSKIAAPYFRPQMEGVYKFTLTVRNRSGSDSDEVAVTVQNQYPPYYNSIDLSRYAVNPLLLNEYDLSKAREIMDKVYFQVLPNLEDASDSSTLRSEIERYISALNDFSGVKNVTVNHDGYYGMVEFETGVKIPLFFNTYWYDVALREKNRRILTLTAILGAVAVSCFGVWRYVRYRHG